MTRRTGYLANIWAVPPLIFRFQFNPELLSEKKSCKYQEVQSGKWGFDEMDKPDVSGLAKVGALVKDIKDWGPLLTGVKKLEWNQGAPRQIALDFKLDASTPGLMDGDSHYDGSIEPDLAILRSFVSPMLEVWDFFGNLEEVSRAPRPAECTLKYAGLSLTCVMTNLNIKITAFQENGKPLRADVSVTLKEQSYSFDTIPDILARYTNIFLSYGREGIGQDFLEAALPLSLFD